MIFWNLLGFFQGNGQKSRHDTVLTTLQVGKARDVFLLGCAVFWLIQLSILAFFSEKKRKEFDPNRSELSICFSCYW